MNKIISFTSIIVPPRARVDYGDIPDLARKIMTTKGLKFNDIVVELTPDNEYHLLAGGRRHAAYELILSGSDEVWLVEPPTEEQLEPYREIPCKILEGVTDEDRILIEFIENMGRKDFTWPEAATLVKSYHQLMQQKYGIGQPGRGKTGWSIQDTAENLGLVSSEVVYYLKLHEGMQSDPALKDIRQKSKALTKLKRTNRQVVADLLDVTDFNEMGIAIECGDSKQVLLALQPDIKFHMCITDPPWDIGFEERISEMRKESLPTIYDTNFDVMDTLDVLTKVYDRLMDNCPIYMFYSSFPDKVIEGRNLLLAAGFSVEVLPLIWYKKHILAHDARETRHGINYETILYGWKGERPLLNTPSRNVLECQVAFSNRIHASEKPESLLAEIILLHTKEGDMVVDPFGGSCKVADACKSTKRKCLVVELDEGLVKMASLRLRGL